MKTTIVLLTALLAGCATVHRRAAGAPTAEAGAPAAAMKSPPADAPVAEAPAAAIDLPTVPKLVKNCEGVLWGTVGSSVLGAVAIFVATSGVDTLNPDPGGQLPAHLRGLKAGAGAVGVGSGVLTAALTSILGQCREDVAKAEPTAP